MGRVTLQRRAINCQTVVERRRIAVLRWQAIVDAPYRHPELIGLHARPVATGIARTEDQGAAVQLQVDRLARDHIRWRGDMDQCTVKPGRSHGCFGHFGCSCEHARVVRVHRRFDLLPTRQVVVRRQLEQRVERHAVRTNEPLQRGACLHADRGGSRYRPCLQPQRSLTRAHLLFQSRFANTRQQQARAVA
jgi:hypothetical protein